MSRSTRDPKVIKMNLGRRSPPKFAWTSLVRAKPPAWMVVDEVVRLLTTIVTCIRMLIKLCIRSEACIAGTTGSGSRVPQFRAACRCLGRLKPASCTDYSSAGEQAEGHLLICKPYDQQVTHCCLGVDHADSH